MVALYTFLTSAHPFVGSDDPAIKRMIYSNFMSAVFLTPVILLNSELPYFSQRLPGGGEKVRIFVVGCVMIGSIGFGVLTHIHRAARSVFLIIGVYHFWDVIIACVLRPWIAYMQSSPLSGIVLVPSSSSLWVLYGFDTNARHHQRMKQFNCLLHRFLILNRGTKSRKVVSGSVLEGNVVLYHTIMDAPVTTLPKQGDDV